MSEIYSPETSAAMRRDIAAWQAKHEEAKDALSALCSDLLDEGVTPLVLGQIINGLAVYGFRHKDGRWFGYSSGFNRDLVHKPEQNKPPDKPATPS